MISDPGEAEGIAKFEDLQRACRLREETARHPGNCIHQAWHDLKEALHVIRVAGTLIKSKATDDDGRNIADFIVSASMDLNQMLNDLPDYARLEAERESRTLMPFDAAATFRDVARNMRPVLEAKGIALTLEGDAPFPVHGDAVKLQRVTENLIRYCQKHGHPNAMSLTWKLVPPGLWSVVVRASVANDETAVLPERIGLAVARGFCKLLEGSLQLEATPGSVVCRAEFPLNYPAA